MTGKTPQRSLIVPAIFTAFTVMFLMGLGFWQLDRLQYKEALIDKIEKFKDEKPARILQKTDYEQVEYRRYLIPGEFDYNKEIHMGGKYYNGKLGYHILNPFRLYDGRYVLVNRGWVEADKKDAQTRPESIPKIDYRQIYTMLTLTGKKGWFTPANSPESNIWFWYDKKAFEEYLGIELEPVVLRVIASNDKQKKGTPVAGDAEIKLRNDHLNYAITWFMLAIGAGVVFYFLRKEHQSSKISKSKKKTAARKKRPQKSNLAK